jgi:regulator of sirC expression with transglutaminase-like and TPR domain
LTAPFADSPEFQRLLSGHDHIDLARAALEIARDAYPEIDVEVYLDRITRLADRAHARFKPGSIAREILGQINWVLFVEEEFRGNREEYYDPRNSYLNEVLDRGLGIPITLSLVYGAIAKRLGLAVAGVDLPLHFMLRVDDGDETCFVDPFHAGALYDRLGCERKLSEIAQQPVILSDAVVEPCSSQTLISRMLRNLKAIYARSGDIASVLPIQRRLTAINHRDPGELRDLGILCVQADRLGEAIEPLQAYLEVCPEASDATEIKDLLVGLRREVARWN